MHKISMSPLTPIGKRDNEVADATVNTNTYFGLALQVKLPLRYVDNLSSR